MNKDCSMPTSANAGKRWFNGIYLTLCQYGNVKKVLDLGSGEGSYARTLRKPGQEWTGVEVWEPYVERFMLNELYDQVIIADLRSLDYSQFEPVDLAICGDVLEHMTKDEALSVVDRLLDVSRFLMISIPIVHYPQDEMEGNPYEKHVKDDWSHEEVIQSLPPVQIAVVEDIIGIYALSKNPSDIRLLTRIGKEMEKENSEDGEFWCRLTSFEDGE
jgi:cyclopropane fatty-acyl-phospholipid synthase-like methyltransferase